MYKVIHQSVIEFQVLLIEALRRGWYPLGQPLSVLTEEYLDVLQYLGRLLISPKRAQLRTVFCRHIGVPDFSPCLSSPKKPAIEVLSVADRFSLLALVAWWLDDWPDRFIAMCARAQLSLPDLGRSFRFQPDWYEEVVKLVARGLSASTQAAPNGLARSAVFSLAALMN